MFVLLWRLILGIIFLIGIFIFFYGIYIIIKAVYRAINNDYIRNMARTNLEFYVIKNKFSSWKILSMPTNSLRLISVNKYKIRVELINKQLNKWADCEITINKKGNILDYRELEDLVIEHQDK